MQNFNFNLKNSIFTKQAIKAAREKAIKKDVQDSTASSNEVKNLLEQKCDNAGIFRDLTDEEVEARLKAEDQSPLSLIKNLIGAYKKDSSGVNFATNQRNDLSEKDSSGVLPPQNDAFRHTEQSEVSQSIQGDGEILRHFVPQNDVLPTAGAVEDSETVLIPNDGDSGISQPLVTEFTPNSGDIGISQQLETEFTPNSGDIGISQQLVTSFTPTPTPVENRANATSSLTIKDADGAKPQTLAAGDKLNVTYVYEDKTFNYTIEAKSAQNVTLQTKDGYFTVVGDNLAVQTGDEQYSFVALIGTTNSIKIGTNGKTYNGNSIAYNSDEGGHSIYTWGDDPTPGPGPVDPVTPDFKLARVGSSSVSTETPSSCTFYATPNEEKVIELLNPFDGISYRYTVKMRDITKIPDSVETSDYYDPNDCGVDITKQNVSFEFLENGRLVVTGSWIDITAAGGQKDDLIIVGHYNNINTGDEDDIVRVGNVLDTNWAPYYYIENRLEYTEHGNSSVRYYIDAADKGVGTTRTIGSGDDKTYVPAYSAVGNHINTGDGDDYVTLLFNRNDYVFNVDMGDGDDKILLGNRLTYAISANELEDEQKERITGTEMIRGLNEDGSTLDGYDGWGNQLGHQTLSDGGCLLLSFINSLGRCTNKENLSEYAQITDNKNGSYTVKFLNYKNVPSGKSDTITITEADYCGITGDLDSILVISAFRKLAIENYNITSSGAITDICNYKYHILSNMFFGNGNNVKRATLGTEAQFMNLISHYLSENGDLKNLIFDSVATKTNYSLGIADYHAYALKSIVEDTKGVKFLELVNPWDDADNVKVSLSDALKTWRIWAYGYSETQINAFKAKAFGEE